jgi:hypothetical protein
MIKDKIQNDAMYRQYFHESIDAYLNRYENRLTASSVFNRKQAEALCLDYLIEECAALCIWPSTGCQFEIYDGAHQKAMKKTLEYFVREPKPHSLEMLNIFFNDDRKREPQTFLDKKFF